MVRGRVLVGNKEKNLFSVSEIREKNIIFFHTLSFKVKS